MKDYGKAVQNFSLIYDRYQYKELIHIMSVLLITGNGFDLANGLPTRYVDFMNYMDEAKDYYINEPSSNLDFIKSDGCKLSSYFVPMMSYRILYEKAKELAEISKVEPMMAAYSAYRSYVGKLLGKNGRTMCEFPRNNALQEGLMKDKHSGNKEKATKSFYEYNACMMYTFIHGNMWLDYFSELIKKDIGENWIDFESEICKVIEVVEDMLIANQKGKVTKVLSSENKIKSISDFMAMRKDTLNKSELVGTNGLISTLQSELVIFVRCLEVYMLLIEQTPQSFINKIPAIDGLDSVDWLLNFNYTDTFIRHYPQGMGKNLYGSDFIHGKAGYNNLIIGIHETLDENLENHLLECSYFKKYFQRIFFKTGMEYKKWIPDKRKDNPYIVVYIFGHSLDVTDGEVLRYIILNENVKKTVIFYHSQDSYVNLINNLTRIIGKDNLITKTGNEEIVFHSSDDIIII